MQKDTVMPRGMARLTSLGSALVLTLGLVASGGVLGCAKEGAAKGQAAAAAPSSSNDVPDVLATVGDQPITMADVRTRVGPTLDKLETQYRRATSRMIDSTLQLLLTERVLNVEAQKQGKSVDDLLAAEAGGNLEPTELEVSTWYQDNQLRLGGRSLDQLRPQILDYLRQQRRKDASQKLEARLNQQFKVAINFKPYRLAFDNTGAASLGNKDAAVTVVEFSDFQCPFCQRFAPNLKRLAQEFGDKVFIVYRQYPIVSLHANAPKAAEASLCAQEQGKFWELHDVMFAEQDRLDVTNLKEKARRIGMNSRKFDSCLDSGKFVEQVQRDYQEGLRAGITGTPAVFVNGEELKGGAVSYEVVRDAVQKELIRAQRGTQ